MYDELKEYKQFLEDKDTKLYDYESLSNNPYIISMLSNKNISVYERFLDVEKDRLVFKIYSSTHISIGQMVKYIKQNPPSNFETRKEYKEASPGFVLNSLKVNDKGNSMRRIVELNQIPFICYIDIDFKNDEQKKNFLKEYKYSKETFEETIKDFDIRMKKDPFTFLYGSSSSGIGRRIFFLFDLKIPNLSRFPKSIMINGNSIEHHYRDAYKDVLTSIISYLNKRYGIRKSSEVLKTKRNHYLDDCEENIVQPTFWFGWDINNNLDLYYNNDVKVFKIRYWIKEFHQVNIEKKVIDEDEEWNEHLIKSIIKKENEKYVNDFFYNNMSHYDFRILSPIFSMLVKYNDERLWDLCFNKMNEYYDGKDFKPQLKEINNFKEFARVYSNKNPFTPLRLQNFIFDSKYIGMKLIDVKKSYGNISFFS